MQVGGARPGRVTHSISWTTVAPFVHYMWLNYWQKRVFLTLTCGRKESDVTIFRVLSDQNWSTLKILVRELALSFWFSLKWALLTFRLPFFKKKNKHSTSFVPLKQFSSMLVGLLFRLIVCVSSTILLSHDMTSWPVTPPALHAPHCVSHAEMISTGETNKQPWQTFFCSAVLDVKHHSQ